MVPEWAEAQADVWEAGWAEVLVSDAGQAVVLDVVLDSVALVSAPTAAKLPRKVPRYVRTRHRADYFAAQHRRRSGPVWRSPRA